MKNKEHNQKAADAPEAPRICDQCSRAIEDGELYNDHTEGASFITPTAAKRKALGIKAPWEKAEKTEHTIETSIGNETEKPRPITKTGERGSSRVNVRKRTPIPLLGLQMAIFNSHPTQQHKNALANLRANLADQVYGVSFKTRERL